MQRVIYVGSFSKTLAPGLRTGYLAASSENIEWLSIYRALHCIAGNNLAERTVYRLLSQGTYRHHCEQLRSRLSEARRQVAQSLRALGMQIEFEPDAGFYLWADLGSGHDTWGIAESMLEQGHLLAPGRCFSSDPKHHSCLRFNVAATLDSPALPALAALLRKH